nr:HEPN domain-containing protein [Paraoerskovia marina]
MDTSRTRLVNLRKMLDELPAEPPEVAAELARFLVVRSAGYIENTFETCIKHFAEAKSHPAIARHVVNGLFRGRNPAPEVLVERTRNFDEGWAVQLEHLLGDDDSRIGRELAYMVDRRNRIAHGRSETVNRRKALDLADIAVELGDWMATLIDPR